MKTTGRIMLCLIKLLPESLCFVSGITYHLIGFFACFALSVLIASMHFWIRPRLGTGDNGGFF
ncbi:hypothetical protein BCR43DRAFT_494663 [Syncephalastrum racemosum]|uniref:Uncharacterized protein n=1 Tax=Syncephalastrum racemosum TaxID=13706 RepID=A0A1X2H8H7_SYNRA|nr:hypothetical protein BCR43DRAFT_494663 [Syncephalastrum racemosum]